MEDWFVTSWASVGLIALSTLIVYLLVIAATRIAGLRSFASMSAFDYVVTVAIGTLIGSAAISDRLSIAAFACALVTFFIIKRGIAVLRVYTNWLTRLIDNQPRLLMRDGEMLRDQMDAASITVNDLLAKLRSNNVRNLDDVQAVILETTGDVSVIHSHNQPLDERLLHGVCGAPQQAGFEEDKGGQQPAIG